MCSILIVEDNLIFRNSLKEMLAARFPTAGIEEASNGDEALLILDRREPDLVLMDIKLPGRNGLELTRAIKRSRSRIMVIILTSYDLPEYREAAMQSGASHFFTKGNARCDEIATAVGSALARDGKLREALLPAS